MTGPQSISPRDFMSSQVPTAPVAPLSGNTAWAAKYGRELRDIVVEHANRAERNLQRHLGPSEIGHVCHRQVAGKLAGLPKVNHISDPWPSIMGVAGHSWMEECFSKFNKKLGRVRFLTEFRVTPGMGFEGHPGTGDGYDADNTCVLDWKFLGRTSMTRLRNGGPPRHYLVQFLLYMLGFQALGLPVSRIVLVAWPRTESSIDGMYVWEHEVTEADYELLREVKAELDYRKQWAVALITGAAKLTDVPADTHDECHFCEFYKPSYTDNSPGCPGDARLT